MADEGKKVTELGTVTSLLTTNLFLTVTGASNNLSSNITLANVIASMISTDTDNIIKAGSDDKLSVESGDIDNAELISSDANNQVSQGTDDLLFVPAGSFDLNALPDGTIDVADKIGFVDVTDSNTNKKGTIQSILDFVFGRANEYTKTQNFNETTLSDAATIAWDASSNQITKVTITANRTLGLPTNLVEGATYELTVIQDGTGGWALAYNAIFDLGEGDGVISSDPDAETVLSFLYSGGKMKTVLSKGYGL